MKPFALQKESGNEDFEWVGYGAEREPADYCSKEGAHTLKQKIEAYWAERGCQVMIALHNVGFHPAIRAARFDVRSDMINGMPRIATRQAVPVVANDRFEEDFGEIHDDFAIE